MPTTETTTRKSAISKRAAIAVLFAAALVLGACANDKTTPKAGGTTKPASPTTQAASSTGGSATPLAIRKTSLGDALVGKDGLTLYGFTNDVEAKSTCEGVCAEAWPPVTVSANWTPGPGLDSGIFATTPRSDGTLQLVAGKWPLYYYSGDVAAGDVTGQGSGDVWFIVAPDGKLIKDAKPAGEAEAAKTGGAPVATAETDLGPVLVDADGRTLYGFTKDTAGTPTCSGGCATAWPAVKVEGDALPAGLDPKVYSLVDAVGGGKQLKAGKWPLYRFSGDAAAGETNGQGSGGVWFVVKPDGSLNKGDAPAPSASKDPAPDSGDSGY